MLTKLIEQYLHARTTEQKVGIIEAAKRWLSTYEFNMFQMKTGAR